MNAQSVAARVHESVREPATELRYEGLVTRGIAFAIDAAIIDLIAVLVAGAVALVLSVLSVSKDSVDTLLVAAGGALFLAWSVIGPGRAAVRFAGLVLAAIPLLAGFLPILFDQRRRGLQDMLAGTVVVEAPELSRGSGPSPPRTPRRSARPVT